MSTNTRTKNSSPAKERRVFAAKVKCEAILAVWSERRSPSEICRELKVPWQQLNSWQKAAMKGMMEALQPRQSLEQSRGPSLSPRLEKLLCRAEQRVKRQSKLGQRLESIQQSGPTEKTSKN